MFVSQPTGSGSRVIDPTLQCADYVRIDRPTIPFPSVLLSWPNQTFHVINYSLPIPAVETFHLHYRYLIFNQTPNSTLVIPPSQIISRISTFLESQRIPNLTKFIYKTITFMIPYKYH
jgi:hypothetical protein